MKTFNEFINNNNQIFEASKKEILTFNKAFEDYMKEIGAKRNKENHYLYVVDTIVGKLYISVFEDDNEAILTMFKDAKKASEKTECNSHNGKWNFFGKNCLNDFKKEFEKIAEKVNENAEFRTEKLNDKQYVKIVKENKSIKYIVGYGLGSAIHLEYNFSKISSTFTGVIIESYIESVRGFVNKYPDFLQECDIVEDYLKKHDFVEVLPSKTEILMYS